jgi:hypothetical protein
MFARLSPDVALSEGARLDGTMPGGLNPVMN